MISPESESITALKRRLRRRTRQLKAEASQERRGLRLFG
jgi:transposase